MNRAGFMPTAGIVLGLMLTGSGSSVAAQEQLARGKALYDEHCALCHGVDGKRGEGYQTPIWGAGTQIMKFETALGLFEYLQMLMPFQDPSLVTDEQKVAIVTYMLANHGAIPPSQSLDGSNMASVAIKPPG